MLVLKCLSACVLLSFAALHLPGLETSSATCSLEIGKIWYKAYTGAIVCHDVTEDMLEGWILTMKFDIVPINLKLWNVDTSEENSDPDPTVKTYMDRGYNGKLLTTSSLYIPFKSDYQGALPEVIEISLKKRILPPPGGWTTTAAYTGTTQAPTSYNYLEVLRQSILFYDAQRSGFLPDPFTRVPWRKSCSLGDYCFGHDMTGGWHDAGDYLKFSYPMAYAVTVLSWGLIDYSDAYAEAGETTNALNSLKWATDYLIKCHISKDEFVYQVGSPNADHGYWGRPEDMTIDRPCYKLDVNSPGTEVAGEAAAALAAAAMAFDKADSDGNKDYVTELLVHAKELYDFANSFRDHFVSNDYYTSSNFNDELVWASIWLYRATNMQQYLIDAESNYATLGLGGGSYSFAWGSKKPGVQALLCNITGTESYCNAMNSFVNSYRPGGVVPYTPKGLAFRHYWGPLRYAAGAAFIALYAADQAINVNEAAEYRAWAQGQIHYILGDTGKSYIVGFGANYPLRAHHRASSCPLAPEPCGWMDAGKVGSNANIIHGAMVGGPDENDVFDDDRNNYYQSEVACDYNAALQSAIAALEHLKIIGVIAPDY